MEGRARHTSKPNLSRGVLPLAAVVQGHVVAVVELVGDRDTVDLKGPCEMMVVRAGEGGRTTQPLEMVMRWIGCALSSVFLSASIHEYGRLEEGTEHEL